MLASVGRLEDSASGSARYELPRCAPRLPERRVERLRIFGVHDKIGYASRIVPVKNFSPALAAVGRLENPALRAGPKDVPLSAHVNDVGIRRMHAHSRDLARLGQPERDPCLSRVSGAPHSVPVRYIAANRIFARAHIDDVRIGLADSDRADRPAEILVRYGSPGYPAIGGLEHTAARGTEVVLIRPLARSGHGNGSATAKWSDLAPAQRGKRRGVVGRRARRDTPGCYGRILGAGVKGDDQYSRQACADEKATGINYHE